MVGVRWPYVALEATLLGLLCLSQLRQATGQSLGDSCTDTYCQNGGTCFEVDLFGFSFPLCQCTADYTGDARCRDTTQCGITPAAPGSPRYFGGSDAPLGKWPWQGYMKYSRGLNRGVTLIGRQVAVTSAANVDTLSTPGAIEAVVFGDIYQGDEADYISDYRQYAYIEEVVSYPGMNFLQLDGDAMVIKFTEPLEITDYVRPICIPSSGVDELADYDVCYTTGWGVNEADEQNMYLKEGRTSVVDRTECATLFADSGGLTLPSANMICSQQDNSTDGPCRGDGGSPLACSRGGVWDLVGVTSWGYFCGGEAPHVHWSTAAFRGFINYTVLEGPEPEYCEPIELEECAAYLPYEETYRNQQEWVPHVINSLMGIAEEAEDCDLEEFQELLCGVSLPHCNRDDEGQVAICREYCESVRELCGATDVQMCEDLPYGADYSQKWCIRGEDYSCGNGSVYLEADSPVLITQSYPEGYPELRKCRWDISAPEGYFVEVRFRHLNIYPDGDFLTFGEGDPYLLTSIVERFDGDYTPPIWRSDGSEMWISFQTNDGGSDVGFDLEVTAIPETGRECNDDDIFCDEGVCYPYHYRCDFVADCGDGTDEYRCNEIRVPEESVAIESPFFPVPGYPPNFTYTWNLEASEGYLVGLSFDYFDLDAGGEDYVLVGEGTGGDVEDALYVLNGSVSGLRILPFARNVWVSLVTDDVRDGGSGFLLNATLELEAGECYEDGEIDCGDGLCISTYEACNGIEECPSGVDEQGCRAEYCANDGRPIPPEESCNQMLYCDYGEDEESCDLAQVGDTWYFRVPRSEDYPFEYIADADVSWIVRAEDGLGFEVNFDEFSTERVYDQLYVGSSPDDYESLELFTGRLTPDPFFIEDDTFFAVFTSDDNKNTGGVTMKVRVVDLDDVFTCPKGNRLASKLLCDGLWHCPDGSDEVDCDPIPAYGNGSVGVKTPRFPRPYENNADVTWTFAAEEGMRIGFFPEFFNTEEGYDFLRVGSGADCRESYYAELTGYGYSRTILSEDNTLCLHFSSDETIIASGINGRVVALSEDDFVVCPENGEVITGEYICDHFWNCPETGADERDRDCPPLLADTSRTLTSPWYPYPYPPNVTVTRSTSWVEGTSVFYQFASLDLEYGVDFVTIGCGDDPANTSSIIAEVTGSAEPGLIVSDCTQGWIEFTSDGNGTNVGYELDVRIVNNSFFVLCPEGGDEVEIVHLINLCNSRWDCPESGADELDCPPLYIGEAFYQRSHDTPLEYPPNSTVVTTASWPLGAAGVFEFVSFDLEEGVDSLTIGCGSDPSVESSIRATLTGGDIPDPVFLGCGEGWTRFVSNDAGFNLGYEAYLHILNASDVLFCPEHGRVVSPTDICDLYWDCPQTGADETDCPLFLVGDSFTLTSPGDPFYPPNTTAISTASWYEGAAGIVEFVSFDLEEGVDFLAVGCGLDHADTSSLVANLTGGYVPDPILFECSSWWTKFVSDGSGTNFGFEAKFAVVNTSDIRRCSEDDGVVAPSRVCDLYWDCPYTGDDELDCPLLYTGAILNHESPGAPFLYPANSTVISTASWPEGATGVFTFASFDLEEGVDFLYIGCGSDPENASSIVANLTGDVVPAPVAVGCQSVWTKFVADDAGFNYGYVATLTVADDADLICLIPPVGGGAPEVLCGFILSCLAPYGANTTCSEVTDTPQAVYSPNYAEGAYTNYLYDVDYYVAPEGYHPVVNITSFATGDLQDTLVIGAHDDQLAVLTGNDLDLPIVITSPGQALWLEFRTDSYLVDEGYYGYIYAVSAEELDFCEDGGILPADGECNNLWDCSEGSDERECDPSPAGTTVILTSPGYPGIYPDDQDIVWTFCSEEGTIWAVEVIDLDIEANFDQLGIGFCLNPRNPGNTILAELDGSELPEELIYTPENELFVTFTSDGSVGGRGFALNVTAIKAPCVCTLEYEPVCSAGAVTYGNPCLFQCEEPDSSYAYGACEDLLDEGYYRIICDPPSGEYYEDDTNVTYVVRAEEGLVLLVNFIRFQTEQLIDFVTVGNGNDPYDPSTQIARFSGFDTPPDVITDGDALWLEFVSDPSVTLTGFCAIISAVNATDFETCYDSGDPIPPSEECNYVWFCEDGTDELGLEYPCSSLGLAGYRNFSSPDYPFPIPSYSALTWSYVADSGLTFNVSLRDFDLPGGNLTIGYGVDPTIESTVLAVITDETDPANWSVPIPGNELWVQYIGGQYGFGFFAELITILPGQDDEICGSFPCYNGGTCTVDPDYDPEYYFCECPHFFTGRNCETHFCDSSDACDNGGTCIAEGETYCLCPEGYAGEFCQSDYAPFEGVCRDYLPYNEAKLTPLVENLFNVPDLEVLAAILVSGCSDGGVNQAVCWLLFPPAYPRDYPYGPCNETCSLFDACPNIGVLLGVDCSVYDEYTQVVEDYPGLCYSPTPCICNLDYDPVCGDDGVTYGNICEFQCLVEDLGYTPGECEDN